MKIGTELKPYTSGTGGKSIFMEQLAECNEQPADYSSTVIASIVGHLTGTQSTTITTSGVLSVTHLSPATEMLRKEMELRMFFLNYEYL